MNEYDIALRSEIHNNTYDAIIIAVAHNEFKKMGADAIRSLGKSNSVLFDLKYVFALQESDLRL